MRRGRSMAALAAFAVLGPFAASAPARSFSLEYRWGDSSWGAQPWFPAHYDDLNAPGSALLGPAGPWYATTFQPGQGLRIEPTGNGGAVYDSKRAVWFLAAPGDAQFTDAKLSGVNGVVRDRQLLRLALRSFDGAIAGPGADESRIADGDGFTNANVRLRPSPGAAANLLSLNMFTLPCGDPGQPACQGADPASGSFLSVRGVQATLDDPTPPAVDLDGDGVDGNWTRARRLTVRATVSDPASGIKALELRASGTGGGTSVGLMREDVRQVVPRAPLAPPRPTDVTRARTLLLGSRARTLRLQARATNGARARTTVERTVRVDRDPPSGLRVRRSEDGRLFGVARDSRSGIADVTLLLPGGARIADTPCTARDCPTEGRTPTAAAPVGRRIRVRLVARDRAGNSATIRSVVRGAKDSGTAAAPAACSEGGRSYASFLIGRRTLRGDDGNDLLLGAASADRLDGGGGDDCLAGGRGADELFGGAGADVLDGGTGRDLLEAGSGSDLILARDGEPDEVDCGSGDDRAILDASDEAAGCEREERP